MIERRDLPLLLARAWALRRTLRLASLARPPQ
jgi:hypothetical protein